MFPDTLVFLEALLSRCASYQQTACLTLTAMHPEGRHPTPSRHIPLYNQSALQEALERLEAANRLGWGAFFAVGLRKTGLTRYRRGGAADIVTLPALYADVDNPSRETLQQLQDMQPTPSCITATGGGYHALWWLESPTPDLQRTRHILRVLAVRLGGDLLSPAQSLRLVGTHNTKPQRDNALCRLISLHDIHYALDDFDELVQRLTPRRNTRSPVQCAVRRPSSGSVLNPSLIAAVSQVLVQQGYRRTGDWLSGPCLYPHRHQHNDQHPSFAFNTTSGYGFCHVCGSMLLKDICQTMEMHPREYGGVFR
jgi:hypothetical protein